jgi:plastocyanin
MTQHISRRDAIRATAAATVGIAVAGCMGGSNDDGTEGDNGGGDTTEPSDDDGGEGDGFEQTSTVNMTDQLTYSPKKIEVEAGTTVTWRNVGSVGHTVTAYEDELPDGAEFFASGDFDSESAAVDGYESDNGGNIEAGESYEYTFETTGTYEYYCIPHEMNGMTGTVRVV